MRRVIDLAAGSIWTTLLAVAALAVLGISIGIRLDLTTTGAIGLYFVVWWTVLFAILPVRIRTQAEEGVVTAGTDPGAPAAPALKERAIWTSIAATIVFAAISLLFPLAGL